MTRRLSGRIGCWAGFIYIAACPIKRWRSSSKRSGCNGPTRPGPPRSGKPTLRQGCRVTGASGSNCSNHASGEGGSILSTWRRFTPSWARPSRLSRIWAKLMKTVQCGLPFCSSTPTLIVCAPIRNTRRCAAASPLRREMMKSIRTLIVDDEVLARRRIRNLLRGRVEFAVIGECANGQEALSAIRRSAPDLIFLDVQMPDLDGFGVLEGLTADQLPVVIFVTAYDQYAVRAFEFHALDYLLKPFDDDRFEKTLGWARAHLEQQQFRQLSERMLALLEDHQGGPKSGAGKSSAAQVEPRPLSRLIVKSAGRVFFIRTEEIDWVEAEGYYARLHVGGKSHLLRETLTNLESQLDQNRFLRIHRSTIVNLERVRELLTQSHGELTVVLADGTRLKLSRGYRDRLTTLLGQQS